MGGKIKILFLCTGNSCRSQMAEGWCRQLKADSIDAYSAGIETHGLNPNAVKVMAEAGVDISGHRSKHVDELKDVNFDYVITVCGHADENCPLFPGKAKVLHVGFDDPPELARSAKTEKEALDHYRRVRDQIRDFVAKLPLLKEGGHSCPPAEEERGLENPRSVISPNAIPTEGGLSSPPVRKERGLENPRSVINSISPATEGGFSNPPCKDSSYSKFYNPFSPVERSKHHLPHRQQGTIYYFVSWHMADSLPAEKLSRLDKERDFWLSSHPKPWDEKTEEEYHDRFSRAIDAILDAGSGSCLLKNPELSRILSDAFFHFNSRRYEIESFVVMPNHVHVLFSIIKPYKLEQIVKSWKGFTARSINNELEKKGELWQDDYWDRMIRSEKHFRKCKEYINENPQKARLREEEYFLYNKEGRGLENPRSVISPNAIPKEGGLSSPPAEKGRGLENPRSVEKKQI